MNDSPCNEMDGELVCALRRGHRTDYHEDVEGHRWPVSPAPSAGTPPVGETASLRTALETCQRENWRLLREVAAERNAAIQRAEAAEAALEQATRELAVPLTDRGKTHYEGCHVNRGHHHCALAKLEAAEQRAAHVQAETWREAAQMVRATASGDPFAPTRLALLADQMEQRAAARGRD